MTLFLQTYLGHLLGDFVFQPGRLVVAKRTGLPGMVIHTAIVTLATAIVTLGGLHEAWAPVMLAGVAHFGIEHLTVRARRTTNASGLQLFLLDQALHVVSLILIAFTFGSTIRPMIALWPVQPALLAGVCGLATVAFLGSILSFEVRIASIGSTQSQPILKLDAPRVYGMVERGGALTIALMCSTPTFGLLAFLPRVIYALAGPSWARARHMTDAAVGILLCSAVWICIALIVRFGT